MAHAMLNALRDALANPPLWLGLPGGVRGDSRGRTRADDDADRPHDRRHRAHVPRAPLVHRRRPRHHGVSSAEPHAARCQLPGLHRRSAAEFLRRGLGLSRTSDRDLGFEERRLHPGRQPGERRCGRVLAVARRWIGDKPADDGYLSVRGSRSGHRRAAEPRALSDDVHAARTRRLPPAVAVRIRDVQHLLRPDRERQPSNRNRVPVPAAGGSGRTARAGRRGRPGGRHALHAQLDPERRHGHDWLRRLHEPDQGPGGGPRRRVGRRRSRFAGAHARVPGYGDAHGIE